MSKRSQGRRKKTKIPARGGFHLRAGRQSKLRDLQAAKTLRRSVGTLAGSHG